MKQAGLVVVTRIVTCTSHMLTNTPELYYTYLVILREEGVFLTTFGQKEHYVGENDGHNFYIRQQNRIEKNCVLKGH